MTRLQRWITRWVELAEVVIAIITFSYVNLGITMRVMSFFVIKEIRKKQNAANKSKESPNKPN